jgi:hypothetical protein
VPEIVIAEPKIFCGSPGERITNGAGKTKAANISTFTKTLVGVSQRPFIGIIDLI